MRTDPNGTAEKEAPSVRACPIVLMLLVFCVVLAFPIEFSWLLELLWDTVSKGT